MPLSSSILSDFEKNIYAYSKKKNPKHFWFDTLKFKVISITN